MARRCSVTGKGVQAGNNVSHANNRTRRRFLPNLQATSLYSQVLDRPIRLRLSTNAIRTIEHKGGIDAWLAATPLGELDGQLRRLKKQVAAKAVALAEA